LKKDYPTSNEAFEISKTIAYLEEKLKWVFCFFVIHLVVLACKRASFFLFLRTHGKD
jgi:hypothetical protein